MGQYYFSAAQVLQRRKQQHIAKLNTLHETISVILIAIWFIGLGTGMTGNGWIHLLLFLNSPPLTSRPLRLPSHDSHRK